MLGIGVDTPVEVAVTRKHGGGVQVAVDDFLLDHGVERTGHAVAGGAGKCDDTETEFFQLMTQARFFQVHGHGFRAGCQRRFDPRLARQPQLVGIARQQAGGNHVAWVAGVGATGDGCDDHRAVGHLARHFIPLTGNALGRQVAGGNAGMRVAWTGHVAHDAGQVESEAALVLRTFQIIGPQASVASVLLHQGDLFVFTAGELEVGDGLLVDVEHRRSGAVLRGHVGNGCAVAQGQCRSTFAEELQPGTDHFLFTQELSQRQHHVSSGDPRQQLAGELHTNAFRQAHP
ncbi:hypothetical protein PS708_05996 [Pseudomonas fluorescens]|nr:hypothetical protein PS708_05459 [Pseudomonas fluorescens]VVO42419.1 hypothetical protein PS708_05996 [Pseudomonas fluorescens]